MIYRSRVPQIEGAHQASAAALLEKTESIVLLGDPPSVAECALRRGGCCWIEAGQRYKTRFALESHFGSSKLDERATRTSLERRKRVENKQASGFDLIQLHETIEVFVPCCVEREAPFQSISFQDGGVEYSIQKLLVRRGATGKSNDKSEGVVDVYEWAPEASQFKKSYKVTSTKSGSQFLTSASHTGCLSLE